MATEQIEEYLEAIHRHGERGERVTTSSLASALRVSAPSVTQMLGRLSERGLIDYRPRGDITLTEAGRKLARSVVRRHRLWERFLHDVLGVPSDSVHDEACRLEHATSPLVEDELARALHRSDTCPHGQAIPDADVGPNDQRHDVQASPPFEAGAEAIPLAELAAGKAAVVDRSVPGKSLAARCLALGITPGTPIRVLQNGKHGPLVVSVRNTRVALGRGEAQKIRVLCDELPGGPNGKAG